MRRLLDVLDGSAISLVVEDEEAIAVGAEFTLRRPHGEIEVHQVKRALGTAGTWSRMSLRDEGVLAAMELHATAGRTFWFVSTTPTPWLQRLAERARRSDDLAGFSRVQLDGDEIRQDFVRLQAADIWGSPENAYNILRHVYVDWTSEAQLSATNAALVARFLDGADPALMTSGLGALISESTGVTLDAPAVYDRVARFGMRRAVLADEPALASAVAATRERWARTVLSELLHPVIPRSEAGEIGDRFERGEERGVLVAGAAGAGKSGVLHQVVERFAAAGWPILAFRVDRLEPFTTPTQLAGQLDLKVSPVTALGVVAGDRPSLLVIDQLDAVSFASGRLPQQSAPIVELIDQAAAFPSMRVLLACRQYDLDNDPQLGALVSDTGPAVRHTLQRLSPEQVDTAVEHMGLDPKDLAREQRYLLTTLYLVLLAAIADQDNALAFRTTMDLMGAFYARKEQDCRRRTGQPVRFGSVIKLMTETMSQRQRLAIPRVLIDDEDLGPDLAVMVSEHVVVLDGSEVAFFHESFFDYTFARRWVAGDRSLLEWLVESEQELFRRAQVRQILTHLRDLNPDRFVHELDQCLTNRHVRAHIKDVMLALLMALPDPTHAEWHLVSELQNADGWVAQRAGRLLRTAGWCQRADAEGALETGLCSDSDAARAHAVEILTAGATEQPDRAADLVGLLEMREQYSQALLRIGHRSALHRSRAFVDRVLAAIRSGQLDQAPRDLFMAMHGLVDHRPEWAAEIVTAWLADRPGALQINRHQMPDLASHDYWTVRAVTEIAEHAPAAFARHLIPYMLRVMAVCAHSDERRPISDWQFAERDEDNEDRSVGDALINGMSQVLRTLGSEQPDVADELIAPLLAAPYESAQWLAYQVFIGAGDRLADTAADVLLEGPARLITGFRRDRYWGTRELLSAVGRSIDDERLRQLTAAILDLRDEDYPDPLFPRFELLSALPEERLGDVAKAQLAQLREQFGRDQPATPEPSVSAWTVRSPVEPEVTTTFSDDQWLEAMREHHADREAPRSEIGGATELARVLYDETRSQPGRFAQLGLRIDSTYHPSYLTAILQGLGEPTETLPPAAAFDLARHAVALRVPDHERWLGTALQTLSSADVPSDIIGLLVGIARSGKGASPMITSPRPDGELAMRGLNSTRGSAVYALTRMVARDSADGHRTSLVAPVLGDLAADLDAGVRAMVADLFAVSLRHAWPEVLAALPRLLDADDALLGERSTQRLLRHLGDANAELVLPVIDRMLCSTSSTVRVAGGSLAAFAALEWERREQLADVLAQQDSAACSGAATVAARRLPFAGDQQLALDTVLALIDDTDDEVRAGAAEVAAALRGYALHPHRELVLALIASAALADALPQLVLTLEHAPDDVGEFLAPVVTRVLEIAGDEVASIASGAAADAQQIGELIIRWYGQAKDADARRNALDLIDALLVHESYGLADLISAAER